MTITLNAAIARIRTINGRVVGAGFLVGQRRVLTCVHVVAQALGTPKDALEAPQGAVLLDFPLVAPEQWLNARVVCWQPVRPDGSGDVAGLELLNDPPAGIRPVRLVQADDLWVHTFRAFGFPEDYRNGVWTSGRMLGREATGWLQIEDIKQTGYFVARGFSGGPVWDEMLDGVVGMIVAVDTREGVRAALVIPTDRLAAAWPQAATWVIPPCPYRGISAFREEDASFFFGRESFVERLVEAVQHRTLIVAVVGPSGSGKSSVVSAGLIPRLRQINTARPPGEGWEIVSFRPGSNPSEELAGALLPLLEPEMTQTARLIEVPKLAAALRQGEVNLWRVVAQILDGRPEAGHVLLVIDQFEELYTLCHDLTTRQNFLDLLLEALFSAPALPRSSSPLHLVLTLRADFLGRALAYRRFADALDAAQKLMLGPMTREELEAAIVCPAERRGVIFEDGLAARILDDVGDVPGNLPLLEFTLTRLWKEQEADRLTHTAYEAIEQVDGALTQYADDVYKGLGKVDQEQARRVFVQLVRPGEGTEDTRRRSTRSELGGANWDMVTRLANTRLVVTNRDPTGQDFVEVAHEVLIRGWRRLQVWMSEDRDFRMWQERLRVALHEWEASGDTDALLRGGPLADAKRWLDERVDNLNDTERVFIQDSLDLQKRKQQQETRRRWFLVVLLFVIVLASVVAAYQSEARSIAEAAKSTVEAAQGWSEQQGRIAQSHALAAQAEVAINEDPQLAILLGLEAAYQTHRETPGTMTTEAGSALYRALARLRLWTILNTGQGRSTLHAAWSADDRRIVTADSGGTARIWDATTGTELLALSGHTCDEQGNCDVTYAAWNSDDTRIVTAGSDRTARVWDAATGAELFTLTGHTARIRHVDWSSDGAHIVTASDDGTARVWDAATGTALLTLSGHDGPVLYAAWSSDDRRIVTAGYDGTAKIWDATAGMEFFTLAGHTADVMHAAWSSDDRRIVTASYDGTAKVWNATTGVELFTLIGHTGNVWYAAWNSDDTRIVTASSDKSAKVWDASAGTAIFTLSGHDGLVRRAVWSPDNRYIVTASDDKTAKVWDAATGAILFTLSGHTGEVVHAAWSSDSRRIVTASHDGSARVWDATASAEFFTLSGHSGPVQRAAWSSDNKHIVTVSDDKTAMVWDAATGAVLFTLSGHTGYVLHAAWNSDNARIVTASYDGSAKIWDAATGMELFTLSGHSGPVQYAAWSPDDRYIVTASDDGTARVWDAATGAELLTLSGHTDAVVYAAWRSDSRCIVTASYDGTAKVWDATTGTVLCTLSGHTGWVQHAAWSSDDKYIVTASYDKTAKVWDAATGTVLFTLSGHIGWVGHAAWSSDNKRIVTASGDGSAKVWDAATGMGLCTLIGHKGPVQYTAWSPDNARIVTTSDDGSAKVWDATTGIELFTLSGHNGSVLHAAWNSDNTRIVTASSDGSARIYFARIEGPGGLLEFACARVGRNLTKDEWERYMSRDVPYQKLGSGCWASWPGSERYVERDTPYQRTCPDLPEGQ